MRELNLKEVLLIVVIIAFVGATAIPFDVYNEKKSQAKTDLETEMKSLQPIPGGFHADLKSHSDKNQKRWIVEVNLMSPSGLDFREVIGHYEPQLTTRGWEKRSGWAGDNYVRYKKGDYITVIEYNSRNRYKIEFRWDG